MVVSPEPRLRDISPIASVIETVDGELADLWEAMARCSAKEIASGDRRTFE
jgi:hypothetical protein